MLAEHEELKMNANYLLYLNADLVQSTEDFRHANKLMEDAINWAIDAAGTEGWGRCWRYANRQSEYLETAKKNLLDVVAKTEEYFAP